MLNIVDYHMFSVNKSKFVDIIKAGKMLVISLQGNYQY